MAVYVDRMRAPLGRMIMCHMIADTSAELHAMASQIDVARRWCQNEGTPKEHYDIPRSKRRLAIQHGAIEITMRELGRMLAAKRAGMA